MAAARPFWTGIPRARRSGARLARLHGLPRSPAGEQPACVVVARGDHVRAVAGEAEQQSGEECRHGGGWVAESEDNLVVDAADIVNGEADDAADWLGVEEQQETRDSFAHRHSMVRQEAAYQGEAALLRDRG